MAKARKSAPQVRQSLPAAPPRPAPGWRARAFRRALARRCPQCGRGALFRGYARLAAACEPCGHAFRREAGSQTGSMYVSAAVTELFAAAVALGLFWWTDWSVRAGLLVGVPLVLLFCYAFLPVSMAFWAAVEYATDVSNGEAWARPRP
jgi:uncharacterized protein (DUF983 family)